MFNSNCGNENIVLPILFKHLPDDVRYTDISVTLDDCKFFSDGWYIFQHMPIPYEWAYNDNFENEFDPRNNSSKIIRFAQQRLQTSAYEQDIYNAIFKSNPNYFSRSFDFVVVEIKNGKVIKWVAFEIASEDHFGGKDVIAKTISDCLKSTGSKTHGVIIDARKHKLSTIEKQIADGITKYGIMG